MGKGAQSSARRRCGGRPRGRGVYFWADLGRLLSMTPFSGEKGLVSFSAAPAPQPAAPRGGFTLVELLVVLATVAILTTLLVPALSQTKQRSPMITCMSNLKQMQLGWELYAGEYNDQLLTSGGTISNRPPWISDTWNYAARSAGDWEPRYYLDKSPLMPFVGRNRAIWRCPADITQVYTNYVSGVMAPRLRTYSMSQVFGTGAWLSQTYPNTTYKVYGQLSAITNASSTFVFIEEHANSINDGQFALRMANGVADASVMLVDYPAGYHAGAGTLSFADGHVEIHKWHGIKDQPPVNLTIVLTGTTFQEGITGLDSGTIADLRWLSSVTTVAR